MWVSFTNTLQALTNEVITSVTTTAGTNSVTLNAVGVQQFYRLHKQ